MPKKSPGDKGQPESTHPVQEDRGQKRAREKLPRIPDSVEGFQANFCRTASCKNFGVSPLPKVTRGRVKSGKQRVSDGYRLGGTQARRHDGGVSQRYLRCTLCDAGTVLRSNQAALEEAKRLTGYLSDRPEPSCTQQICASYGKGVHSYPTLYYSHGKTRAGSPRWRCKTCGTTFADRKRGRIQHRSNENLTVFRALVNKSPIRSIARLTELSPKAVYDKIEFIHQQCLAFVGDRERRLPNKAFSRLWLSTDRQDYVLNWTDRRDKRNTKLTAVGTADNATGYVFGQHLNYDPDVDPQEIEDLARDWRLPSQPTRKHQMGKPKGTTWKTFIRSLEALTVDWVRRLPVRLR